MIKSRKKNRLLLFFSLFVRFWYWLLLLVQIPALQAQIGNEWINPNQNYYKIPTIQDGMYRLSYQDLSNAGITGVNPQQIQIFHRGTEQAIYIQGEADGTLDPGDYIEFYGRRNDGFLDTYLYGISTRRVNDYYNLYSDTTAYFLTWTLDGSLGKRMENVNLNVNQTPEPSHLAEALRFFSESFSIGQNYPVNQKSQVYSSYFDTGEGWTSGLILEGGARTVSLNLSNIYSGSVQPELEVVIVGDYESPCGSSTNYQVEVSVGTTNLRFLETLSACSHFKSSLSRKLNLSDISGTGAFRVRLRAVKGAFRIVHVRLVYPQRLDMNGTDEKVFGLESKNSGFHVLEIDNPPSTPAVYNISTPNNVSRIVHSQQNGKLRAILPASSFRSRILVNNQQFITPIRLERVELRSIDPTAYDYLMITNKALRKPAGGHDDIVKAYADYRASEAGGSFRPLLLNISDLYNQFSYGERTPLAIRRFAEYMFQNGNPEYIFIIGKSVSLPETYFRPSDPNFLDIRKNPQHAAQDLVPTAGFPPSDIAHVTGLANSGTEHPSIPIGRIGAYNPQQVHAYLNKIIEHESAPPTLWQKNIIHLSGGNNEREQDAFKQYLQAYQSKVENGAMGAQVSTRSKSTTSPVETINISEQVNEGVGLITFFGHSGPEITDIEIGKASDDTEGYRNRGLYPMILTNGCQLGSIFYDTASVALSQDWVLTPERGAIGFIAHTFLGFEIPLRGYSDSFYNLLQNEATIGRSVGKMMQEAIKRRSVSGNVFDETTAHQMFLHGDPAVQFFKANKPDYEISNNRLLLEPIGSEPVSSVSDSIQMKMIVSNVGIVDNQPFYIRIKRTLSNGEVFTFVSPQPYNPVAYQDTLVFTLYQNDTTNYFGNNLFEVSLDPEDEIDEQNENNNTAFLEFFVPSVDVIPLTPLEYAIANEQPVTLTALASNLGTQEIRPVVFEIDTSAQFNSNIKQRTTVNSGAVGSWDVNLLGDNNQDSLVYYWRVNYADAINDPNSLWGESSFTYIRNSPEGWSQSEYPQFTKNILQNLRLNPDNQRWEFQIKSEKSLSLKTLGGDINNTDPNYVYLQIDGDRYVLNESVAEGGCGSNSLVLMHFGADGTIFPPQDIGAGSICGRDGLVYFYNNNELRSNPLRNYLSQVKEGDYVLLFTIGRINFSEWTNEMKSHLAQLGANPSIYNSLQNGHPYLLLGRRGADLGTALEATATNVGDPTRDQVFLNAPLSSLHEQGAVSSTRIGPAKAWKELIQEVATQPEDDYYLEVYGISLQGIESPSPLLTNIRTRQTDLSSIDAEQYPYLRLRLYLEDGEKSTPPQLQKWLVIYDGVPDGYIDVDAVGREKYELADRDEGENINLDFAFRNLSNLSFDADSLTVRYTITNLSTLNRIEQTAQIKAPAPKETVRFAYEIETEGLGGDNRLQVYVNPQIEPEVYYENNIFSVDFRINPDDENPLLEVAFDGRQIMDGEIVAPEPLISVVMRDNSQIVSQAEGGESQEKINLALKKVCDGCDFEEVDLNQANVVLTNTDQTLRVDFRPETLEDGIYTLKAQGEDAFGNKAGTEPYLINFEVVNESTITNFYPYPNPFSTSTRFVFTLTGREIPQAIKIQIMTVSGKVVREITQDELGPIRIGNNLTEYAWDGRDEFGDRLANGVYLYRVLLRGENESFDHRATSADKAFKNGYGKLYILR